MKQARPSVTAAWVAAARSFGDLLPDELHLAEDPYGAAFANTTLPKRLSRSRLGRRLALSPGLGTWIMYMQVRTRVLDDIARAFAREYANAQVVLLGAGYDCRALRLGALANVPVFEVDHPATQSRKQRVLARLGAESPAHYVTWDFEARPLAELPDALAAAGLDRTAPVLTIWEGVTMYLTRPAIDASLSAIHAFGPGRLAMTYFERARIDSPSPMMRLVRASVRGFGEPFKWAWNRDEVAPYLAEHGFRVRENRSLDDAAHDFLPARAAALVQARNSCYALAEVV
ncbi:MAG: SAM-dependent methyltransferase [Kofleriaceae bacterium]